MQTIQEAPMSKKMGRPTKGRDDVSVKVDRKVVAMAKMLAPLKDQSIAELISETLRPIFDREVAKELRKKDEENRRDRESNS